MHKSKLTSIKFKDKIKANLQKKTMEGVLKNKGKTILLGNEAIVRGALESGVEFVASYPGTPASEIGDTFAKLEKETGVYFEYSTNEKVALEAVIGASYAGLKSLVAMKNFGLNVASDSLMPFCYTGTVAPAVIVVADDPSCHSSGQSEQNTRAFANLAHIPILEPSDPQESKDFTKLAFQISEKFKLPVILRTTTRVAHQRAPVKLERILKPKNRGKFEKNPERFVTMPPRVLQMKKELLEKIERIKKEISEKSSLNKISKGKDSEIGIITSGVSWLYTMEALKELNLNLPVLKLGFFYPLPERKIKGFIKSLKKVLVVEELEPYLEKEITGFAKDVNPEIKIFGKNLLPIVGELKPEHLISVLAKLTGKKWKISQSKFPSLPKRTPQLCPGCPYWLVFQGIKKAVNPKKVIFGGEIGCYMLSGLPPHNIQDYLHSMGSSVGIAHGIKKALKLRKRKDEEQKLIAFIGDSSFFHAGIPALINAVHNKSNPLIIIMDNLTTAMTGQQPHPGVGKTATGEPLPKINIEDIIQACGVRNLKIIDPINQKEFIEIIKSFLEKKEVSVIITRRPCIFVK